MSSRGKEGSHQEGPIEIAGMLALVLGVMVFLVWIFGSRHIVTSFTPVLRALGSMWMWLPAQLGVQQALEIYSTSRVFLQDPARVGFVAYLHFANLAITPLVMCALLGFLAWFAVAIAAPSQRVFRRFAQAEELLEGVSRIFTGTAPILHLRKALAQHKDPRWARQRFPEEVLFQERVGNEPLVGPSPNGSGAQVANLDAIERWFKGIEASPGWTAGCVPGHDNLRRSRTLGHQIVDLTSSSDRAMFGLRAAAEASASFVDRFSDVGQVMFGLLCAHAFGGKQGMEDYRKARDQLNNSCRGTSHGLPKLAVAQWIVDKYRHNDLARRLCAVHHWEYTYLLELFIQAKRRGKVPDSEFRWLKPASRTLWYVLNTAGRFTPHTDSAAAFNQHAFERKCARRKRWPLRVNGHTGCLEPSIHVKEAVAGLELEFERWVNGTDENDDEWWKDIHEWVVSSPFVARQLAAASPTPGAAASQMTQTNFDQMQSQAREQAERNELSDMQSLLESFGSDMGVAGGAGGGSGGGSGLAGAAR